MVATELGKRLAVRGHQVHFISYDRPFKLDIFHENIFHHEVEVIDYPLFKFPPYMMALASKIAEVSKWAKLDLVHVHYAIPHSVSAFLARQLVKDKRLPIVTTLHGTDITIVGHEPQFYDLTKFSIEESDMVTAVSQSLKEESIRIFKLEKDIRVIYNFVDPEVYHRISVPGLKERFAEPDEKVIIHVSNFRPVKRLKDVVDIFSLIRKAIPAKLLMVGDGPDGPAIHQYIDSIGLSESVRFLGKQEWIIELLSISDLCLLPSEKESFGLVALEAMACGVPVVATKTGGLPEVVRDGDNGYLLPVGNIQSMAEKALMILQNESLWQRMSRRGRQVAADSFHIDKMAEEYEKIYCEVI